MRWARGRKSQSRRHDPEAVDMAAVEQVHGVDRHPHVGRALALDHVELLHRHDRMHAGQRAPALEAGLGPIAVGAADVDRAQLAQHQQHLVEMVGRGIVGVDQQGDVQLGFGVSLRSVIESFALFIWRSYRNGVGTKSASGRFSLRNGRGTSVRRMRVMKRLVLASAIASSLSLSGCATNPYGYDAINMIRRPGARRPALRSAARGGAVLGAVVPGVSPVDRRGGRRGARRRRRRGDQGPAILSRYPRLLLLRRPVRQPDLRL